MAENQKTVLTEEGLKASFHLIRVDWKTGEM